MCVCGVLSALVGGSFMDENRFVLIVVVIDAHALQVSS